MITIELLGLPGAGKTTLYAPLMTALSDRGAVADGYSLMWQAGRNPRVAVPAAMKLLPILGTNEISLLASSSGRELLRTCLRQQIAQRRACENGKKFCLFQEGAIHEAWRLYFTRKLELSHSLIVRLLRLADVTVYFDVSPAIARERIRGKPSRGPINRILAESPIDGLNWQRAAKGYERIRGAALLHNTLIMNNDASDASGAAIDDFVHRLASEAICNAAQRCS